MKFFLDLFLEADGSFNHNSRVTIPVFRGIRFTRSIIIPRIGHEAAQAQIPYYIVQFTTDLFRNLYFYGVGHGTSGLIVSNENVDVSAAALAKTTRYSQVYNTEYALPISEGPYEVTISGRVQVPAASRTTCFLLGGFPAIAQNEFAALGPTPWQSLPERLILEFEVI